MIQQYINIDPRHAQAGDEYLSTSGWHKVASVAYLRSTIKITFEDGGTRTEPIRHLTARNFRREVVDPAPYETVVDETNEPVSEVVDAPAKITEARWDAAHEEFRRTGRAPSFGRRSRAQLRTPAANERLAAEDRRLADLSALTPELRSKVLAKLAAEEPQRIARAVRYVLAFEATLAAIRPGDPRPNVLPSGAWCAYAEDHGTDRWHEHDHMACQDVQAEASAQATFDDVAADNTPERPWGSASMDAKPEPGHPDYDDERAAQLVAQTHGCPVCQTTDHGPDECYDEDDEARADDYRQLDREQYEGNFDTGDRDVERPQS